MAQETKSVTNKKKHREDEITPADDEIEEIEIAQNKSVYDKVTQVMEKFATTRLGQVIIERTDRILKIIEETAKWSLPPDANDVPQVRPLPWMFFLTLIVCLRFLRIGLSLVSFVVGSPRVTPESMVYYIQIKRRRLRALRLHGVKVIRSRELESSSKCSDTSRRVPFVGKIRTLLGNAICTPGQIREVPARRAFVPSDKPQCSKDTTERSTKRPRDDDSVDLNLTVDQMLDKYANEDSDGDSDYIPKDDEDSGSLSTSCTSSSSDETEKANTEKEDETPEEIEKSASSQNDNLSRDQSILEIKENGNTEHRPIPSRVADIKLEPLSDQDSENERVFTPKENDNANELHDDLPQPTDIGTTTEVATPQPESMHTPNIAHKLLEAPPQMEEDKQKSTPGHTSAATLKPVLSTTAAAGSPQDFHSIFHPAPIVKVPSVDAHSTPKVAEHLGEFSSAEIPETAAKYVKKPLTNSNNNKQHFHHHNAKNRNKNRR